jgi:hypothetical protein
MDKSIALEDVWMCEEVCQLRLNRVKLENKNLFSFLKSILNSWKIL